MATPGQNTVVEPPSGQLALEAAARLMDPHFYWSQPFDVYARLRREAPVFWSEAGQLWALSKYDDLKYVSHNPQLFSSGYGVWASESLPPDDGCELPEAGMPRRAELRRRVALSYVFPGSENILAADPPRHGVLRRLVGSAFTPRMLSALEDSIRSLVVDSLEAMTAGETADFVNVLAAPVPLRVIARMLGLPDEDCPLFRRWTDTLVSAIGFVQDPESEQAKQLRECAVEFVGYVSAALRERVVQPRDDLLTHLVQVEADGERLSEPNQVNMVLAILFAGNSTTRDLITGGAQLLAEHPDQRQILVEHPGQIPNAVDEILRLAPSLLTFCRTATQTTTIRGQTIARGDYVLLLYGAANRDEEIWERAEELDVTREPDPMHLAFGFGEHYCLGAALARREARIVFEELLRRFPRFEIAGDVVRVPSTMTNSIDVMPMAFR